MGGGAPLPQATAARLALYLGGTGVPGLVLNVDPRGGRRIIEVGGCAGQVAQCQAVARCTSAAP